MSTQTRATQPNRIDRVKGEILAHVIPKEVIGRVGVSVKKTIPKNVSELVTYRRWLPKGATANSPNTWIVNPNEHRVSEGETPVGETLIAQDINAQVAEYAVLYRYTNRTADFGEEEIPSEMIRMTGERKGLLLEMIRWGVLRGGTNVFYPTTAVTSRSLVGGAAGHGINPSALRRIARAMSNNLASKVTGILDGSPKIGTQPIEAAFVAIGSTDFEADLRANLPGFVHISEYGSRKAMHEDEIGSWEQFRFVGSPHLSSYIQQGANSPANTYLTNGAPGTTASDVYPMLFMAEDAFGDVMVRGKDCMSVTSIPASTKTKDDPLGQRGVIGASCYFTAVRLNEGHMAVGEFAVSALAA